ncbi:uncharacterized protein LOC113799123 [Dermatophagoides pteronyssinus]|uniref:uncharacterized protein LOC113799123 n=1 Tax=Dermatophagoides pteronyssinus TaxID=6956 RepID=UPI003F67E19D
MKSTKFQFFLLILSLINPHMMAIHQYPSSVYGFNRYGDNNIDATIISKQNLHILPIQNLHTIQTNPIIDIKSNNNLITIRFNTISSTINTIQKHHGNQRPKIQHSKFMAEPDILIQNIQKPIIQKVHEIIQPYRKIYQEILPVKEKIETIISKDSNHNEQNYDNSFSSSSLISKKSIPDNNDKKPIENQSNNHQSIQSYIGQPK